MLRPTFYGLTGSGRDRYFPPDNDRHHAVTGFRGPRRHHRRPATAAIQRQEDPMSEECLFCKIIKGDIPARKLYEDDKLLAFWDIAPQAPKHFLVIPKQHVRGPGALSPGDEEIIGAVVRKGAELAAENGIPDFRLVINNGAAAGQTVFHLHMHVLGGRPLSWPPG
jgi:histidine triad (HIT) family protein